MTTATFPSRPARTTAAAVGLAAALALTGCSSGGDSGDPSASPSASATDGAGTGGAGTGGGSGSTSSAGGKLQGSWLTTAGGKAVVLMINGKQAGLFATGGTMCSGTSAEEANMRMIRLTCTDGSKKRAVGMVDSVSGTTLKVTWEGDLGQETYTKSEGGELPTGLPTASLGS
ncbi:MULTISPECIES: hypothetical protein [unclassified Streptomyces]|uniref:hypothetical protein n=1 Tax=unclassified Streptomyces TaxID=2593676 RepID=UPI00225B3D94|nr:MULTISPECIES: hypothetical protein [unclassified Streptomyces]MCX4989424.1 hypothetical protein [Streptomyces sp. NBC_00568]MCX5005354.1 hypothetical protein [Streptomyces sp. NBC_00638]